MNPLDPADSPEQSDRQTTTSSSDPDAKKLGSVAMSDPIAMHNPLVTTAPGETVICEIKRHPIGILTDYVIVSFLMLILGIAIFVIMPSLMPNSGHDQVLAVSALIFLIAAVVSVAFLFIVNKIYWGNRWIVTSDSVTQITQTGLFRKQSSQMAFDHLEDVTVEQNGIAAQFFHYGVLSVETAGAVDKFTFLYCPNPTYYAKQILAARERFEGRPKE